MNEIFLVNLNNPLNANIADNQALGTILNDDSMPSLSINDVTIMEGNSGEFNAFFRVSLSAPSGNTIVVSAECHSGSAQGQKDYNSVPPPFLYFLPGEQSETFNVPILGDTLDEPNETFYYVLKPILGGLRNATIPRGRGICTNLDDTAPLLAINDASISEGDSGTKLLTFTVALSKASGQNVTVNYATADAIAWSTSDYTAKIGTLTFTPGSALTRTVSITVNGDTQLEANETLYVLLSGAVNASIGRGRGMGTITNDDTSG